MSLEREYHTGILGNNVFLPTSLRTSGNSIQSRFVILYLKACMAKAGVIQFIIVLHHATSLTNALLHDIFNTVNRGFLGHESVKRGRQFHAESWSNEFAKVYYYIKILVY